MSVWLRQADSWLRLELTSRWRRPPVVAPPASTLRALVRARAGFEDASPGPEPSEALLEAALADSGGSEPFALRAARARSLALVLPDATRCGAWQAWVATVAAWLERRAPQTDRRTLLVAGGVHRPQTPPGLVSPPGWGLAVNGAVGGGHRVVGSTRRGTPVRLHPDWVDADLKVALGDVSYHYFAGFGGGRKLVFPGLAEADGIMANHRLALDLQGRLHPACEPGRLEGNPVHEDLLDAAGLCPPDLLIQLVETRPGAGAELQVGDWRRAHEAGCLLYREGHRLEHTARPRALVADAGGRPRDATFLQAHKSLQHAARFLPDGGRLLLVAGLEEGSGSATFERLWGEGTGKLAALARERYELHTHTALAFASVRERLAVGVWTLGDPDLLRGARVEVFARAEEALDWIGAGGDPGSWGWIPRAEEWLPRLIGRTEIGARPASSPASASGGADHE